MSPPQVYFIYKTDATSCNGIKYFGFKNFIKASNYFQETPM